MTAPPTWEHVGAAQVLGAEPLPDVAVVVVGAGAVDAATLAARQAGRSGVVVVGGAPGDVEVGHQGALAGVGAGWAVDVPSLAAARDRAPVSEAELRWLLWNDGVAVEVAPGAAAVPLPPTDPVTADRVPLAGVRPGGLLDATTPTISFVVHGPAAGPAALAARPARGRVPAEVLVVGDDPALPTTGRLRRVADVDAAVADARGAVVWFVRSGATVHREAYARVQRRLDDPRVVVSQAAYAVADGPVRSVPGLVALDAVAGAPVFAAVRRRALRQRRGTLAASWPAVVAAERGALVVSHPVAVDLAAPPRPVPSVRALAAGGRAAARELAGDVVARVRDRRADDGTGATDHGGEAAADAAARGSVGWVGFAGKGNFGDELVLRAGRELLAGVDVVPGGAGTLGTVLGGGTLLNAGGYYRAMADRIDVPGHARLVLGTGVVSPDVAGFSEDLVDWRRFLVAGPVGVRGPHSLAHLRSWGHDGPADVLGDPALALTPTAASRPGLVALAPIGASSVGQVEVADERAQRDLLVAVVRAARADGRPVALLAAHPGDDRVLVDLLQALDGAVDEVVHAHRDLDAGLRLLAAADVVVGARLHALVAAAAAGTPFLGLAYRPKVADFAASVGRDEAVRPIAAWSADALVGAVATPASSEELERLAATVDGYRAGLRARAAAFVAAL